MSDIIQNSNLVNLDRLNDIVVPPAVLWWPPAPGWLWLGGIVLLLLLALLLKLLQKHQQNCYRREALKLLSKLQQQSGTTQACQTIAQISLLLKRTALSAYQRPEVAQLTGPAWFAFLDRNAATAFSEGLGQQIEDCNYALVGDTTPPELLGQVFTESRIWIKQHRAQSTEVLNDPAPQSSGDEQRGVGS